MVKHDARLVAVQALRSFARACQVATVRDDAGKAAVTAMRSHPWLGSRRPFYEAKRWPCAQRRYKSS